jgi:hypothetical protein
VIEPDRIQIVAIVVSACLLVAVLELVRRRKLVEEYSLVWIGCAIAMLGISIWRGALDVAARTLGIYYPPSLLLLLLAVLVFVALLSFSVVLSRQRQQINRLMEETATLGAEVRELRGRPVQSPGAPKVPAP